MAPFKESEILVAVGPRISTLAVYLVMQKRTHKPKSNHTQRKSMSMLGSKLIDKHRSVLFAIEPRVDALTMHHVINDVSDIRAI